MKELSLNLLDIAENSVRAGATRVEIDVFDLKKEDVVSLEIRDNGCGMSPEFLASVTDPFTTTRTTRRVGLGLPLLKMEAEQAEGGFEIESEVGKGTRTKAWFKRSNIDMPPLGDLSGSMITLIQGSPEIDFIYRRRTDAGEFTLSIPEAREELGGISVGEPEILAWIGEYLAENEAEIEDK